MSSIVWKINNIVSKWVVLIQMWVIFVRKMNNISSKVE